jgi:hypothetical protein
VDFSSPLLGILFRLRDTYQVLDANDTTYPFTFRFLCSSDGGLTYDPAMPGCRWNNTTTQIHQIEGRIPEAWDNLGGFDTDPEVGRITADGFVSAFGDLMPPGVCLQGQVECFRIKLVRAFAGKYATSFDLLPGGGTEFDPAQLPERDIYFCGNVVCDEFAPGAKPSGWLGAEN